MPLSVYCAAGAKALLKKLSAEQIDHMIGVGIYAGVMAQKINDCRLYAERFSQRQIEQISEAAFYHDIGKVWLPREILLKRRAADGGSMSDGQAAHAAGAAAV